MFCYQIIGSEGIQSHNWKKCTNVHNHVHVQFVSDNLNNATNKF